MTGIEIPLPPLKETYGYPGDESMVSNSSELQFPTPSGNLYLHTSRTEKFGSLTMAELDQTRLPNLTSLRTIGALSAGALCAIGALSVVGALTAPRPAAQGSSAVVTRSTVASRSVVYPHTALDTRTASDAPSLIYGRPPVDSSSAVYGSNTVSEAPPDRIMGASAVVALEAIYPKKVMAKLAKHAKQLENLLRRLPDVICSSGFNVLSPEMSLLEDDHKDFFTGNSTDAFH